MPELRLHVCVYVCVCACARARVCVHVGVASHCRDQLSKVLQSRLEAGVGPSLQRSSSFGGGRMPADMRQALASGSSGSEISSISSGGGGGGGGRGRQQSRGSAGHAELGSSLLGSSGGGNPLHAPKPEL